MNLFDLILGFYIFALFAPLGLLWSVRKEYRMFFLIFYSYPFFKSAAFIVIPAVSANLEQKLILIDWILINTLFQILVLAFIFALSTLIKKAHYCDLNESSISSYSSSLKILPFWVIFAISGVFLFDAGGLQFFLEPRKFYEFTRGEVGLFWVTYYLSLSVIVYFYALKVRSLGGNAIFLVLVLMLYYLTGSKHLIVVSFLFVYFFFTVKLVRLKFIFQLSLVGLFFLLLMLNFDQFGSGEPFFHRVENYFSSLYLASLLFEALESGALQHGHGEVFLSSFWSYIPRVLFDEKPYAYGPLILNELFFPGQARLGLTPSFGPLSSYYYDFGLLSPFVAFFTDIKLLIYCYALVFISKKGLSFSRISIFGLIVIAPGFGWGLPNGFYILFLALTHFWFKIILVSRAEIN